MYSSTEDLLTGNIPVPSYLDPMKFVQDAADEIDSYIGFVYQTPIDVGMTSNLSRPARLLLKRINNYLATGRLLQAAAAAQQDDNTHAYATRLITEALSALQGIAGGSVVLDGAPLVDGSEDASPVSRPVVNNEDEYSQVEAFYNRVTNPLRYWGIR